jgi:hypothetical protein
MANDDPSTSEWRRSLAVEAFNGAWDLIDQPSRTPGEDRDMLVRAAASRYLWDAVGSDDQRAVGDWQIAHVLSWMGEGSLALRFAAAALERAEANGWEDWRRASCLEGVARAHAVLGDEPERDRYASLCQVALGALEDPEDRDLIASQLATVPGLSVPPSAGEQVPTEPHPGEGDPSASKRR